MKDLGPVMRVGSGGTAVPFSWKHGFSVFQKRPPVVERLLSTLNPLNPTKPHKTYKPYKTSPNPKARRTASAHTHLGFTDVIGLHVLHSRMRDSLLETFQASGAPWAHPKP